MDQLETISEEIRHYFEEVNAARDLAYQRSRELVSICSRAIRAVHRSEWDRAETLMGEAKAAALQLVAGVQGYGDLYHAGYTQDSLKEYVEAYLTYAIIRGLPWPTPAELGVEYNTWLNGLAEATTELRRTILDLIRHGHSNEVERLLSVMEEVYSVLVVMDFNDAITGGLRRRTDTVRGVLERTRADVTTSLRQAQLEQALARLEARLLPQTQE
ncbi:MAG: haloacid dehalogenase [Chloroflexi bacterium]|nr:haloacid dehalogenase [Chloroflexota bacterium]MBP8056817.1 haloacid dehalogenase [Chloroflexota bacterium]